MPTSCDKSKRVVCGCNGVTYDNECSAFAVGVSIANDYACNAPPPPSPDRDVRCILGANECANNEYCAVDEGQCMLKSTNIPGRCRSLQDMCQSSYMPVCGCDDETYGNADCAAAAGVNVMYDGECTHISGSCSYSGVRNDSCSGDEFCRIGEGECRKRNASQDGYCHPKPNMCSYDYKPVCGCDSETYANECDARSRGVNVMKNGECNDGRAY